MKALSFIAMVLFVNLVVSVANGAAGVHPTLASWCKAIAVLAICFVIWTLFCFTARLFLRRK